MYKKIFMLLTAFSLIQSFAWGADKSPVFTQKDFAKLLLQQFSFSDGLPKEPTDRDYLMVLGGKRKFIYEAENAYNEETDLVTFREFPLFGSFTGKGWIMGVSNITSSTMTILLPIAGEYDLKAFIKGHGFIWNIDGKEYSAASNSTVFRETKVAKLVLKAGVITIKLTIPPEGAIDSFSLSAKDFPSIQPFQGWRFKEPLTAARMSEIAVAMTDRFSQLPDAPQETAPQKITISDSITVPPTATLTDAAYLGAFTSPKWLRADYRGSLVSIPLKIAETGYYGLTVNAMGQSLTGSVNGTSFNVAGKAYLSKVSLGLYRLESGDNNFVINLPPTGGIDTIEFSRKSTTPGDFMRLAGISGEPDRQIGAEEAATFLKKIQGMFQIRR